MFDATVVAGSTSKIVEVMLRDSTTGQGKTGVAHGDVTASYVREGGTRTAVTLASGSAGDTWSSGKWAQVDSTNCPGLYQLHIPDAAIAAGVPVVTLTLKAAGVIDCRIRIALLTVNLRSTGGKVPATLAAGDVTGNVPAQANAIANDAITNAAIADNAISSGKLATNAITTTKIGGGAITADKIADNALTGAKFANGAFDAVWTVTARSLTTFGSLVTDIVTAVWTAGTRTLTAFGFTPSLDAAYDAAKTSAQAGDAMTLTSGEREAIAEQVEFQILDEGDNHQVIAALVAAIEGADLNFGEMTIEAIAHSVWDFLTEDAETAGSFGALLKERINDTITSRLAAAGYTAPDNAGIGAAAGAAAAAASSAGAAQTAAESADAKLTSNRTGVLDSLHTMIDAGQFTEVALENAPTGSGGGGGETDWTATERQHIRHRLGINGSAAEPSATPSLATAASAAALGTQLDELSELTFDANASAEIAAAGATEAAAKSNAIHAILAGITSLAHWLRAGFRKSAPDATALAEINAGGGTFSAATDALEAIRDRGDAAWTTGEGGGGGGGGVTILPVYTTVQREPVLPRDLDAYTDAGITHQIAVFDQANQPIGLTDKTLTFTIDDEVGRQLGFSDVAISGEHGNVISFDAPAAFHVRPGKHRYAVREPGDDNRVWARGAYTVHRTAGPPQ
ncbi:MAG: hypothetical protein KF774_17885 [Planctomyces sp.]|nr:hypothetical protein [Planctomyces sp.]